MLMMDDKEYRHANEYAMPPMPPRHYFFFFALPRPLGWRRWRTHERGLRARLRGVARDDARHHDVCFIIYVVYEPRQQ